MICIGNQTACWAATAVEPFDYALAQSFDAFEWFPDKKPGAGWDETDLDATARQHIRDMGKSRGIRYSVHARWQADLLAPDSYPLVLKDLELARDLGAVLLNVHYAHEQGTSAFVKAIVPLLTQTAEAGLQLSIENTPHHSPEQLNELFERLRALKSAETGHVGMCLDLGHANLCAATRNDYLGFVDRLDPRVPLIHLHLHENWGDADTHLPLFTGPAGRDDSGVRGLIRRLVRRNFSGSAILEQWPHPPSLLNNARDKLLEMWKNGTDAKPAVPKPPSPPTEVDPIVLNALPHASEAEHVVVTAPPAPVEAPPISPLSKQGGTLRTTRPASAGAVSTKRDPKPGPLSGALAAELIAGDAQNRSWREKLDFVRGLLARETPPLTADDLIDIAIYLRLLGTGEISSSEDGRHFRPSHHARIASQIQDRLAQLTTPENVFIVRKIYPWLPSSAPAFQRPEPLTRIRDIAHRNDIDPDLKREIKTTLQNKLHRCAGPEDLVTATALLVRITAPGSNYSPAFVEQFKIFHEELKEFFNAGSLDQRLAALAPAVGDRQAELIELFGRQKAGADLPNRLAALRTLTSLRQSLLDAIEQKPGPANQEFLQTDIALEDFAFVLLSEIINAAGAEHTEKAWDCQMEALTLALRNVALGGIVPAEAHTVEAELEAWGRLTVSASRNELLRLRATMQRCRRLAEDFGDRTVALFAERAQKLGRALGVADHAVRVFSEADIRAHIIFQVSKLATNGLRRLRQELEMPPWDVLVSGRAVGRVKRLDSLEQLERGVKGPLVVLLKHAAGDEEVPQNIAGIVLAHELPHLSHLGVRARQAGIVFAACEESSEFESLQRIEGQMVAFHALPDQVALEASATPEPVANQPHRSRAQVLPVRLRSEPAWLPLEETVTETGGGKAAGARRLAELSRLDGAGFSSAPAFVIPFGVMEAQVNSAPALAMEYQELVSRLNGLSPEKFTATTQRLRELLQTLTVPDAITVEAMRRFGPQARVAVRSSANFEDVEGMAGAGLYDSVLNIAPADVASAVRTVWSSLWTRRAALSRQQSDIPHEQAHMAVLIQEMVVPDYSFVLHTVNPINHREEELYAEIAVGLGDTLASAATRGSPYRMVCDKNLRSVSMLAFANFNQASRPSSTGGLRRETIDYSKVELSRDSTARQRLGRRLAAIGQFVENALEQPQDIEGAVAGDSIFLVQARPQPGVSHRKP